MGLKLTLPERKPMTDRRPWHGMAFIMEALVLLVFLVVSVAILMQLFGAVRTHNEKASVLSTSILLASNEAERFTIDPVSDTTQYYTLADGFFTEAEEETEGTLKVNRTVRPARTDAGIIYYATITVEQHDLIIYEIDSACYSADAEVPQ